MSSYSELVKNFERVRAYMREFYVFGFKSREEYDKKSARSYDDERRRMESWLKDYMRFYRTPEGKSVFLSIDSRAVPHNPFYRALQGKSFTDGDITLHFLLLDILHDPARALSLHEILQVMERDYLACFEQPTVFDESTVRKKLKEYREEGLILQEKQGKTALYRRAPDLPAPIDADALSFFSEAAPLGAIGYFLLQKGSANKNSADNTPCPFSFKHHFLASALDGDVELTLLEAMHRGCAVTITNYSRRQKDPACLRVVPLRICVSAQNGRRHLMAYHTKFNCIKTFRIDYISNVVIEEPAPRFGELRGQLDAMKKHVWGVSLSRTEQSAEHTEHAEFTVRIEEGEEYVITRLQREKRIGNVERLDEYTYRFTAELYDSGEIVPFVRTFTGRIVSMNFANRSVEKRLKDDLKTMYALYGIGKEET